MRHTASSNSFQFMSTGVNGTAVCAYIYTCNQAEELYGIHLEYTRLVENGFNENILVFDELSLQQIINTLITHFDITSYRIRI